MKKYLLMASLLVLLSACPSNVAQSVNVSISPELLENLQGARGANTTGTDTDGEKPVPPPAPSVDVDAQIQAEIEQMVNENASALNQQNYEAYIATVHPRSGLIEDMTQLFFYLVQFETQYFIDRVTVLEQSDGEAYVMVQQRISDLGGVVSSNVFYTLAKDGSRWKIMGLGQRSGF